MKVLRVVRWLVGAVVGLVGLSVVGLMLYGCIRLAFETPRPGISRLELLGVAYVLIFLSVLCGVACLRLIVPQLRADGGRVFSPWMLKVVGGMYLAMAVAGLVLNTEEMLLHLGVLLLGVLVVLAVISTANHFGRRSGPGQ